MSDYWKTIMSCARNAASFILARHSNQKLAAYQQIFAMLSHKQQVIEEVPVLRYTEESSDALIDIESRVHRLLRLNVVSREVFDETELKRRIADLNAELLDKDESALTPSQWANYPFLICQYRGIHYFKDCFTDAQRRDHMETVHLNRLSVAPAVYYMLKSTVGKPLFQANYQMARETDLDREKLEIREIWNDLKSMKHVRAYWKEENAKSYDNAALMINERMATKYNTFKSEANAGNNAFTALLKEKNVIGYPAYATSDLPVHALKYAYGRKKMTEEKPQTETKVEPRLRPNYLIDGTPQHPHLGKVYLAMFTPLQMLQHSVQHVAGAHNRGCLELGGIGYERESSALGAVQPEIVFYEELLTVPDLRLYNAAEATNSGYTQSQWNKWEELVEHSIFLLLICQLV